MHFGYNIRLQYFGNFHKAFTNQFIFKKSTAFLHMYYNCTKKLLLNNLGITFKRLKIPDGTLKGLKNVQKFKKLLRFKF